jgi:hypothetical protein
MKAIKLIGNPEQQLNQISKVGELNPIEFARQIPNYNKLRDLNFDDRNAMIGVMFTKITLLMGIKNPISDLDKNDIISLLITNFRNLSLEEINYAFQLERYKSYPESTDHYHLFNASYVASILNKYKEWLQKTRFQNNIPLSTSQRVETLTDLEKDQIIISGIIREFDDFIENGFVGFGASWIYDHLYEHGIIEISDQEKKEVFQKAKAKVIRDAKADKLSIRIAIGSQNANGKFISESKRMILNDFFKSVKSKSQLETILNNTK